MRRGGALVVVLLCVGLGGCLSGETVRPAACLERMHPPRTGLGPDGILIDFVLIERPLGDAFLNDEVWQSTNCQCAGLEQKGLLDDNGFRVGQVIGMNPAKLQNLISTDRYCVSKRRQVLPSGSSTGVALGPAQSPCSFRLRTEDGETDVLLDQGQCSLIIEPTLTSDGRTRLKFIPQIHYGTVTADYQPTPSRSGWQLQYKRPAKIYPALNWEVTLAPNEYLVIGTHFDKNDDQDTPQTLGGQCFVQDNDRTFVQRLLVIRTTRGSEPPSQAGAPSSPGAVQPVAPAAHCLGSPAF
jgi:hypothetical protein